MTEVKMYMANDGKTFTTKEECANYENEIKKIKTFKRTLTTIKDYCIARTTCANCPFEFSETKCMINGSPDRWNIKRED